MYVWSWATHKQPQTDSHTHTKPHTQRERNFSLDLAASWLGLIINKSIIGRKFFGRFVLYGIIKWKFMLDRHFYFQLCFSKQNAWCENINRRSVNTVWFSRILTVTWLDFYCVVTFCTIQRSELIGMVPLQKSSYVTVKTWENLLYLNTSNLR